jgi:hypothetical protein
MIPVETFVVVFDLAGAFVFAISGTAAPSIVASMFFGVLFCHSLSGLSDRLRLDN